MTEIYLDHAAMTPALPCALEAYRTAPFGNPSSEHAVGQAARDALEQAREKIARLMGCGENDTIVFTSTATEAAALASYSLIESGYSLDVFEMEHHAVSENASAFRFPRSVTWPKDACARMAANNESGEILCPGTPTYKDEKVPWLCDATAAVGHIPVSFKELCADYMLFDGIKFGSVPGAAALVARKNVAPLSPLIRGGGQERGMRSGTENVPAICAMAAALEWQTEHMKENAMKLATLFAYFQTALSKIDGVQWNTPFDRPHLPHILNVSFPGADAHALALLLSKEGVMVSPGAACSNGLHEPSHVILAMFHDEQRARSAIRISLSHENTMEECRYAAEKIKECVAYLRSLA